MNVVVSLFGLAFTAPAALAQQDLPTYFEIFGYSIFGRVKPDLTLPRDAQVQLPDVSAARTLELDFQQAATADAEQRQLPEHRRMQADTSRPHAVEAEIIDPASATSPDPAPTPATRGERRCAGCTQSTDPAAGAIRHLPDAVFQSPSNASPPTVPPSPPSPTEPLQPIPAPTQETAPAAAPFDAPGAAEFFGSTRTEEDQPIDLATRPIIVNHPSTR